MRDIHDPAGNPNAKRTPELVKIDLNPVVRARRQQSRKPNINLIVSLIGDVRGILFRMAGM